MNMFDVMVKDYGVLDLESEMVRSAVKCINDQRIDGIKERLIDFGFHWENDDELKSIFRDQLHLVTYSSHKYVEIRTIADDIKICGWYDTWNVTSSFDQNGSLQYKVDSGFPPDELEFR